MKTLILIAVFSVCATGCGKEIGDSCIVATDCDPNGMRTCDLSQKGGYCTIMGCDFDTCPDQATCVRFFMGTFDNETCDHTTEDQGGTDACSPDELCALTDHCVARSTEIRYCMKTCKSDSDCRDGYECRTYDKMIAHGGEPVLAPGVVVDQSAPGFCAIAPVQ